MKVNNSFKILSSIFISLLLIISIFIFILFLLKGFVLLPIKFNNLFYAALIAIIGIMLTLIITIFINKKLSKIIGKNFANSIKFLIQLVGYIITGIAFFNYLGIGLTESLAAGGFTGLILGLASQTVLSNIFGGISILISKPFKLGDRITLTTWQYGLIMPSYPPKFWSNDYLIPGFTGKVLDISLMYTTILTDENLYLKIPNNIMIQAAIIIHGKLNYRLVRTKYEVSKNIDPDKAISNIKENLKGNKFLVSNPDIKILDTTFNTYILVIDAMCYGEFEETPRSEIIKIVMRTINDLSSDK